MSVFLVVIASKHSWRVDVIYDKIYSDNWCMVKLTNNVKTSL